MTNTTTTGFEANRGYLVRLAYRMLGSLSDAEDVVQDAWLRWHAAGPDLIVQPRAWLAQVVTRLCLDLMKSARHRRESYVGGWLPEPLIEQIGAAETNDDRLDLPYALMLALERLSPLERAAFLLHDIFDRPFAEVAETLERSEAACRQLVSRARRHVQEDGARHKLPPEEARRYATAFFEAAHSTDPTALRQLLARDAILHTDGGGKVTATLNPIFGADKIGRFFAGLARKLHQAGQEAAFFQPVLIDGLPGYLSLERGGTIQATALDIRDSHIVAVYVVRNPEKLGRAAKILTRAAG
ncbi:MAG: sigma-70 family RNA polymerase sigma factor [Bosea sp. (in: a-proteobacteria)]|uniref:sigma-70 family RNA polymerase sigma factor n=1 Tax=Bosea sp. (in: a-proteobacteria) TaxID=1871050 RepID=UPI003F7C5751